MQLHGQQQQFLAPTMAAPVLPVGAGLLGGLAPVLGGVVAPGVVGGFPVGMQLPGENFPGGRPAFWLRTTREFSA